MPKQGRLAVVVVILGACLSGCIGGLWTGASMVYDRHNVYKKINDYHLLVSINKALYVDKKLKNEACAIDVAVFNGDVLLVGHLPTQALLDELKRRISPIHDYRRMVNAITVSNAPSNAVQDSWITTKIRSKIFANDKIDPTTFKIVTSDQVVYLMGDVRLEEAEAVIQMARRTNGVLKVVKILKFFTYENNKAQ